MRILIEGWHFGRTLAMPMTIFGDGTEQRALTNIDDVAPTIAASVDYTEARNKVFNVGADVPYTVNDLAEMVADAMGMPYSVVHLDARNEVKIAFSDHSKAERAFGKREKKLLRSQITKQRGA
jgi:UDP-glucose 4-epimerase